MSVILLNASSTPLSRVTGCLKECHMFMDCSLYTLTQFYAFCVCYECFFVCLGVIVKWENCVSLQEITIYQVRLTISPELLSRSRAAECPKMRFLMDGRYSLSRA